MEGTSSRRYQNKIRQFRMEKGLTQRELAHIMGYKSVSSLAHLEAGKKLPSLKTTLNLQRALQRFIEDIYPRLNEEVSAPVVRRRTKLYQRKGITGGWS